MTQITKIVGIDYSLSCPAMCILDPSGEFEKSKLFFLTGVKKHMPYKNIHCEQHKLHTNECQRYEQIANFFMTQLEKFDLMYGLNGYKVFLEDYSFGSKGRVFHIAENTGMMKYKLYKAGIPVATVPPTVLKKFATGKGNANKDAMYSSFCSKNPSHEAAVSFYITKGKVTVLDGISTQKVESPVSDLVDAYFLALYGASQLK